MPQPIVENQLFTRITLAAKTYANWTNSSVTTQKPKAGEVCLEIQDNASPSTNPDTYRIKIGDGRNWYADLPYYGDFSTLDSNGNLQIAHWDGTNNVLEFYDIFETDGIIYKTQNPSHKLKAGSKVTFSMTTVSGVNVVSINHAGQVSSEITEDTATLSDGGTFKVATGKDEYGHINEWTTFTLPSIASAIATAIEGLDSSVASTGNVYVLKSITETNGKLTAKTETQIVGGTNMSVVGTDNAITINHDPIDQTAQDAASGITSDHSSPSGERNMDIITGFKVDAQGHVIHIDKDSSMNLIAADIKAPVKRQDDSTWNYRETGGDITIGEDTARIPVLKGNTIVWNQLIFASIDSGTESNVEYNRYSDGSVVLNGTANQIANINLTQNFYIPRNNHKIYIALKNEQPIPTGFAWGVSGYGISSYTNSSVIFSQEGDSAWLCTLRTTIASGTVLNNIKLHPIVIDLTKLFGSDFAIEKALLGLTTEVAWNNLTADQLALAAANFEKLFPNSYYPYCEGRLVNLGGYGVKMNQLVQNGNFADGTTGWINIPQNGTSTMAVNGNELTVTITSQCSVNSYVYCNVNAISRHIYLLMYDFKNSTGSPYRYAFDNAFYEDSTQEIGVNTYTRVFGRGQAIQTDANTHVYIYYGKSSVFSTGYSASYRNVQLIDLTLMFGAGNEPSLEECEQIFTEDYYEYNTGTEMNIFDAIGDKKLGLISTGDIPDESEPHAVDMGLPSGLLWADSNIDITQEDGFAASPYQYGATFFSWGNVKGQNPNSSNAFDESWGSASDGEPYVSTPGAGLTTNIPYSLDFDAAYRNTDAPWRMPTSAEFQELKDNCDFIDASGNVITGDNKLTTVNGIVGIYMRSKINGNRLFFACSGYGNGTSWGSRGSHGFYWSASFHSARYARILLFYSGGVNPQDNYDRFIGFEVRPVRYKKQTLDLDWIREIEYTPSGSSTPEKLFPYGLLSAGSVHDEVTETKAIKRVGVVDLGTITGWFLSGGGYGFVSTNVPSEIKLVSSDNFVANIVSSKFITMARNNLTTTNNGIGLTNNSICISSQLTDLDAFESTLPGVLLYYELATPIEIPLDTPHPMIYVVADHGTEQQLPINVSSVINAPFVGTFEYYSNFKDAVLDLINRVNGYTNPVRGKNNSAQTEGKLAEYDSDSTVKSSLYAPSNATIVAGADGNEYILPSVAALVAYVQNLNSSALHYRGLISQLSSIPTTGQASGDLYIFSAQVVVDSSAASTYKIAEGTYDIGDFIIWHGTDIPGTSSAHWDVVQGTVRVSNNDVKLYNESDPNVSKSGSVYTHTIATIEGTPITIKTDDLSTADPSAGSTGTLEVISNITQNAKGKITPVKKPIQNASVSQKGVVQLERDIHYSESPDKVPSAGQTWRELSKRNVKAVPIAVVPVPAVYNTDLYASYELEASSNKEFTVNNSTFAQVYAQNMGGYLFYVNNCVVYAAKMKATNWTKFDDDTDITPAIRAATETMIHVPTCNYKASGKKMKFGGLNPLYGGDYFKSPRWVGAYQMDMNGHSRPGVGSGHSKTMTEFWNLAQAIHHDFGLANNEFHNLINALYQAMFGDLNSEYVLSDSNSRSSSAWDSYRDLAHGAADSLADGAFVTGPHCVAAVDGAGVTRYVTKFCGFEDLFGKLWEFRPGIRFYMDNGVRKAVVYDGNIVSNSAQGRIISGVLASASGQFTTEMELGEHWDMLPKTVGGSSTTYYCDGYWASTSGELLLVGSYASLGSLCGISCSSSYVGFSYADAYVGARLAFYGEPTIVSGAEMVAMMA